MGCDIHMVVERRVDDKWITISTVEHCDTRNGFAINIAKERNYRRFAKLAGVRGDGPKPKGLPKDCSETAKYLTDKWGVDGHSHSWLPLKAAAKLFLETEYQEEAPDSLAAEWPASHYFGVEDEGPLKDYRLVFWFDN